MDLFFLARSLVPLLELLGDVCLAALLVLLLAQYYQYVPLRLDAQLLQQETVSI
jgi:hypothetical protein